MPSTLSLNQPTITTDPELPNALAPNRKVRVIHRDSFGTSDRGEDWGWSAQATWWHQMRGVKGFHKRILFGFCPKSEYPAPPTVNDLATIYNELTKHTWAVSP